MSKWQGTPVPNTGYVENVYFNTNLSVEEVVGLLESANLTLTNGNVYMLLCTNDASIMLDIMIQDGIFGIRNQSTFEFYFHNATNTEMVSMFGFEAGWNPNLSLPINISMELIANYNDMPIGVDNDKLSTLFSTTPFVQEQLTLNSFLTGIADAIRSKKGTTDKINASNFASEILSISGGGGVIEVEEFPTENVQEGVIYKRITNNPDIFFILFGESTSLTEIGMNTKTYVVEVLPENMELSDLDNGFLNLYIVNGICYMAVDMGDGATTLTLGEFFTMSYSDYGLVIQDKGLVDSIENQTEDGVYVVNAQQIALGVKGNTYNFDEGYWEDYKKSLEGLADKTIRHITLLNTKEIPAYFFYECRDLISVNLPKVESIGLEAFRECVSLKELTLPNLTSVSSLAFLNSGIETLNLPKMTSTYVNNALAQCPYLKIVYIPKMITLQPNTFFSCYSLRTIIITQTDAVTSLIGDVFNNCYHILGEYNSEYNPDSLQDGYIYVPDSLVDSYKTHSSWSKFASQIKGLSELPQEYKDKYGI